MLSCAVRAGFGANSQVLSVGDGAPWIVGHPRVEKPGGSSSSATREHAEHMLALRINRINGDWDAYWKSPRPEGHAAANDHSTHKPRCPIPLDCITLDRTLRSPLARTRFGRHSLR